jgi:rfaE bifunctional protein nucleotidyltransferase chain/domain
VTPLRKKILSPGALRARLARERRAGRRIVFTNGCFDVLHRGHVTYLEKARTLGDVLVVALNSDRGVRRLKGPGRPLNPLDDRLTVIAALEAVDFVTSFDEVTPVELASQLRPDILAKGGDYSISDLPEATAARAWGGKMKILSFVKGRSTTKLIKRARSSRA